MDDLIIGVIYDEEEEWVQLFVNNHLYYEGHQITDSKWLEILEEFCGATVTVDYREEDTF